MKKILVTGACGQVGSKLTLAVYVMGNNRQIG